MHIYLFSESWLLSYIIVKSFIYTITLLGVELDVLKHFFLIFLTSLSHTNKYLKENPVDVHIGSIFLALMIPVAKYPLLHIHSTHLSLLTSKFLSIGPLNLYYIVNNLCLFSGNDRIESLEGILERYCSKCGSFCPISVNGHSPSII